MGAIGQAFGAPIAPSRLPSAPPHNAQHDAFITSDYGDFDPPWIGRRVRAWVQATP